METIFALLGGGGLVAVTTFAVWALLAERRAGQAEKREAVTAKDNETLKATCAERAAVIIDKEKTIHALDAAVARYAAKAVGPVPGALAELLQEVADTRRIAGGSAVVPDAGAESGETQTDHSDPDGLLRPGE